MSFSEGDAVEVNYRGKGKWFPGRIYDVKEDGSFDIEFDDGDSEKSVPIERIRSKRGTSSPRNPVSAHAHAENANDGIEVSFSEGDAVEVNYTTTAPTSTTTITTTTTTNTNTIIFISTTTTTYFICTFNFFILLFFVIN